MKLIIIIILIITILIITTQAQKIQQQQQQEDSIIDALQHLKSQLIQFNPSHTLLSTWTVDSDHHPCSWQGIICSNNRRSVTHIQLSNNSFVGPIPTNIITLFASSLTSLDLSCNQFNNTLPPSLFESCPNLISLNLSFNPSLKGVIPTTISNCTRLSFLSLEGSSLTGAIPEELGFLPHLQQLSLSDNHLYGSIPSNLFLNCQNLQFLDLSLNNLSGAIPSSIANCRRLSNITVSQNQLNYLPPQIGELSDLYALVLGRNNFTSLPQQITNCSKLQVLILNENSFTGEIPVYIDAFVSLTFLIVHHNHFTGAIPSWLSKNHKNIVHLDLSSNDLHGNIPSGFSFPSLKFLLLADNRFTGSIPEDLSDAENLQFLDLSGNQLTGRIPAVIGKMQKLLWLMVANNQLSGSLPSEIGNCSSLLWLNAANNKLTGDLPSSLEFMGNKVQATFADNQAHMLLIPKEVGECAVLQRWIPIDFPPFNLVPELLDRDRCQSFWNLLLRGKFIYSVCSSVPSTESMGYIQLSQNRFTGRIPESFGRIAKLSLLYLYQNNLTGAIPAELSLLKKVTGLNLSHNALSGQIPSSLGQMRCLQSLDLSNNNLSGRIPFTLVDLTSLNRFNISHNPLLSGPIPFQQQLATFGENCYIGNNKLCYIREDTGTIQPPAIPFCGNSNSSQSQQTNPSSIEVPSSSNILQRSMIWGISLACGLVLIGVVGIIFGGRRYHPKLCSNLHHQKMGSSSVVDKGGGYGATSVSVAFTVDRLTYTDLMRATCNFDESNVVGSGGFGIVYKARLGDDEKSTVAIKKLISEGPQADREFFAEMHTLGHVRHENLVALLGFCTFGAQKLLVYEYMQNGSLDDWLHGDKHVASFDWGKRLNVAIGTARGLTFLHHSCSPPIIHRDMKASNILLDDTWQAKLTDFGLARVLAGQEETHVSTVVAGTLGYVPPEYCQTFRATTKGDVYSFGVVMLELIAGRRPMDVMNWGNLVEMCVEMIRRGKHKEFYDPIVMKTASEGVLVKFLKLAINCTKPCPAKRPSMLEALQELEAIAIAF